MLYTLIFSWISVTGYPQNRVRATMGEENCVDQFLKKMVVMNSIVVHIGNILGCIYNATKHAHVLLGFKVVSITHQHPNFITVGDAR